MYGFFDEVYVKMAMLLHGGTILGKAVNNPDIVAKSVLRMMVVCF